jgi:hypothetical protein
MMQQKDYPMTDTHDTDQAAEDGGVSPDLQAQLEATLWLPHDVNEEEKAARRTAARAMLADIDPAEGIEAMLACQMVAAHEAAMACLVRSTAPGTSPEQTDRNLKHAERLLAIFTRQVDTLDRHRVREAERQDQLEQERRSAERKAFLDSVAPTQEMVFQSLLDFVKENEPDDDEDYDEDYDEIHIDFDKVRSVDASHKGTNGNGAHNQGADRQGATGGRRDPDPGEG